MGAPSVFPVGLVMAPHARELTFIVPSWRSDRSIPTSALAAFAEGVRKPRARTFKVGEPTFVGVGEDEDENVRPEVFWAPRTGQVAASPDMVRANRVMLAGSMATYLDRDGELTGRCAPDQPVG